MATTLENKKEEKQRKIVCEHIHCKTAALIF